MTLKELSQLYYLNREIQRDIKRLKDLKMAEVKTTARYSDMPKSKSMTHDIMAEKVATIVDLEEMLEFKKLKRVYEEKRLMHFIESIDDCFLRLIFKLRFIDCKKWDTIACYVGGGNTGDSIKKNCYRYITRLKSVPNVPRK